MEAFLWLCAMSAAMFVGSMLSGVIPLKLSIAERNMKMCNIFGAGLLLGTAFSVIIPEGIETLYGTHEGFEPAIISNKEGQSTGELDKQIVPMHNEKEHDHSHHDEEKERRNAGEKIDPPKTRKKRHVPGGHDHEHNPCEEGRTPNINAKMGFSLIFGFMFMLIVDQVSSWFTARGERAARGRLGLSATIGLVVHAAADGIAMGSATFSKEESLKFIVFFAIILHKMPASFGLVSFLKSKLPERKVYKYLGVFSSAAPAGAFGTYFLVNWLYFLSSQAAIACLMLFSAGTFLYVATIHVFPDLVKESNEDENRVDTDMEAMIVDIQQPALAGGHSHAAGPSFSIRELLFMIAGAILPGLSMTLIH